MLDIFKPDSRFIKTLSENLREADREEVTCFGVEPYEALQTSCEASYYYRGAEVDTIPAAIWGVCGGIADLSGSVWLMTGPAIELIKLTFLRQARFEVFKMQSMYPTLICHVSRDYTKAIKLVKLLGFEAKPADDQILQFEMRS